MKNHQTLNRVTLSDGTEGTVVNIVRAVEVQFDCAKRHIERYHKICNRQLLENILESASTNKPLSLQHSQHQNSEFFSSPERYHWK
jgi:regulator of PEP synthase PpsR (kinase-PPPase family)